MALTRRIPVLLSLVAYVAAGVVGAWQLAEHHHHHVVVLRDAGERDAEHGNHSGCCSGHHHQHAADHQNADQCAVPGSTPHAPHHHHHHHDDDCEICQDLAQKPLPVAVAAVVSSAERVEELPNDEVRRPDFERPALPLSRAPPRQV